MITLEQANTIIAAAFVKARTLSLKPLTVAVLDTGGRLLALQRQDGASLLRPEIAIGKAAGALGMGMSSRKLGEVASERPDFVAALTKLAPDGLIPAAGGLLIVGADRRPVGAVGVTGDSSENDEICAAAGLAEVGLASLD